MGLFLIERGFAEQVQEQTESEFKELLDYNKDHELRWFFSFLSADKRKSYCLYEAPDADAIRQQAADLGVPADAIIEVSEVNPDFVQGLAASATGHPAT
ncbi:MAG: DUF4242 domain-containing protein [Actinomycetota bacterium]